MLRSLRTTTCRATCGVRIRLWMAVVSFSGGEEFRTGDWGRDETGEETGEIVAEEVVDAGWSEKISKASHSGSRCLGRSECGGSVSSSC